MKVLTENKDGVFQILVKGEEKFWIAHPHQVEAMQKVLEEMTEDTYDKEKLYECGFCLEDESDIEDREIVVSDTITDDYIAGSEMGFMLGYLFHAGYTLAELMSDDFNIEETYAELIVSESNPEDAEFPEGDLPDDEFSDESYEFTGDETNEELDDFLVNYYEKHGYKKDTLTQMFEEIDNVCIRNRIKLRLGGLNDAS